MLLTCLRVLELTFQTVDVSESFAQGEGSLSAAQKEG